MGGSFQYQTFWTSSAGSTRRSQSLRRNLPPWNNDGLLTRWQCLPDVFSTTPKPLIINPGQRLMLTATDPKRCRVVHLTSAHSAADVRIFHKECRSLARAGYEVIVIGNHPRNETVDGVRLQGLPGIKGRLQRMTLR